MKIIATVSSTPRKIPCLIWAAGSTDRLSTRGFRGIKACQRLFSTTYLQTNHVKKSMASNKNVAWQPVLNFEVCLFPQMIRLILCHGYTHPLHRFQKVASLPLTEICDVFRSKQHWPSDDKFLHVSLLRGQNGEKIHVQLMSAYQFGNLSQRLWAKAPLHSISTNLPLTSNDGRYRQTTAVKSSSVSVYTCMLSISFPA